MNEKQNRKLGGALPEVKTHLGGPTQPNRKKKPGGCAVWLMLAPFMLMAAACIVGWTVRDYYQRRVEALRACAPGYLVELNWDMATCEGPFPRGVTNKRISR